MDICTLMFLIHIENLLNRVSVEREGNSFNFTNKFSSPNYSYRAANLYIKY